MPVTSGHYHFDPKFPPPEHDANEVKYLGFNRDWGCHFFEDRKTKEAFVVKPDQEVASRLEDIRKRFR